MKTKFIVLIDSKGRFLSGYKQRVNGFLAYEADFNDDIEAALKMPVDTYCEHDKDEIDSLAEAFGCKVAVVEAEYNLTYENTNKPVKVEYLQNKAIEEEEKEITELANKLAEGVKGMFERFEKGDGQ